MNVYECIPEFTGENFYMRGVLRTDAEDLLKVYSDEKSVPLFNGDNCHGDDFHYTTLERMNEAIGFWLWSYEQHYFVRLAIIEKKSNTAIGTIELFHRDSELDIYNNCGLLRLDLRSDYESSEVITEILSLIKEPAYELFECDKIATKVKSFAAERIEAVTEIGFEITNEILRGNQGEEFSDYYICRR